MLVYFASISIQLSNEVKEALGLTDRKCNAMGGELEESKALLDAAVRGQRQVEQELSDTREQGSDMQGTCHGNIIPIGEGNSRSTFSCYNETTSRAFTNFSC